ncbi:MAG: glycosyltransferase family 1 protein [Acidiphilium sp.]|nr:glycosyltransferase family 1 protein [Acidiphilium sp.]MDD4935384.1 glycosyltransferase family 1 protein [Acidiphilium sp.]
MTIWVDVDDLISYFYAGNRPSGIQRLSFDLTCALIESSNGPVRACRHGRGDSGFTEVDWRDCCARLRDTMSEAKAVSTDEVGGLQPVETSNDVSPLRRTLRGLPLDLRAPLATILIAERNAGQALRHAAIAQIHAARALRDFIINYWHRVRPPPKRRVEASIDRGTHFVPEYVLVPEVVVDQPVRFVAGDVLISTGATWQYPSYSTKIDRIRAMGVRFAPFAHDMVPLLFPEWSVRTTTDAFDIWAREVLTRADILFTNSNATARDVARYARHNRIVIPPAIKVPMGASFPHRADPSAPRLHDRPFVLVVSTIEPRKNHAGMLRLWRRIIQALPENQVPDLVFAGRVGWLAHDVVAQAENADWFGGKLHLIQGPSDTDLATLYRDCLFTIYPSFYEGWGLPVTESLSFGKPVAASNRASIPEAGGAFCVYFDPDDLNDAFRVIAQLILAPERVAALEQKIALEFRPPSWADSAAAIIAAIDAAHGALPGPDGAEVGAVTLPRAGWRN